MCEKQKLTHERWSGSEGRTHRLFSTYCRAPRSNGSPAYLFRCSRCLCSCPWVGCCSRGNIAPEDKQAPRKPLAKRARALIWTSPTQLIEPLSTPYLHFFASRLCFSKVVFLIRFLISLDISGARVRLVIALQRSADACNDLFWKIGLHHQDAPPEAVHN